MSVRIATLAQYGQQNQTHSSARTLTLEQPRQAPPQVHTVTLRIRPPGEALGGGAPAPATPRPAPAAKEAMTKSRLQQMTLQGAEGKIQELREQMAQRALSAQPRAAIDTWSAEFATLQAIDTEGKMFSLSVLVLTVMGPLLELGLSLAERDQLLLWRDDAYNIIQQLLPEEESLKNFLDWCKEGLAEEKTLQEQHQETSRVVHAGLTALETRAQEIHAQIGQGCTTLQQRLVTVQTERKQNYERAAATTEHLRQETIQQQTQLTTHATAMTELGRRENQGPTLRALAPQIRAVAESAL